LPEIQIVRKTVAGHLIIVSASSFFFNDFHWASYREKTELNTQLSGWDC